MENTNNNTDKKTEERGNRNIHELRYGEKHKGSFSKAYILKRKKATKPHINKPPKNKRCVKNRGKKRQKDSN